MKIPSMKSCDICRDVVAEKSALLYRTIKPYITMKYDESLIHGNDEDVTRYKHICLDCWNKFEKAIEKEK